MPARCAASATARYMAPVSTRTKPSTSARRRATVLLPAPAGPSMATMGRVTRETRASCHPATRAWRPAHSTSMRAPRARSVATNLGKRVRDAPGAANAASGRGRRARAPRRSSRSAGSPPLSTSAALERPFAALDVEPVGSLLAGDAEGPQHAGHGRDAVAPLLRVGDARRAVRARGERARAGARRSPARPSRPRSTTASQRRAPRVEPRHRLAVSLALGLDREPGAHVARDLEQAGARRVGPDAAQGHARARRRAARPR